MSRIVPAASALSAAALAFALGACQMLAPVVPEDAAVERIATGYRFTEGPASDGRGNIYFTDIPSNRILRYNVEEGRTHIVAEDSGGANGLMFDPQDRLLICEGGDRRVTRLDLETDHKTTLAAYYGLNRLNSPNDLVVDRRGGIYFSDPRYGDREDMEIGAEAVYYLAPNGDLTPVITDLRRPNGLILSNDGRTLHVADEPSKNIWAYDVQDDGMLGNARVFAWLDPNERGGGDGMTVDARGNIYCAGQGVVWVWDRHGRLLDQIPVPEPPSNVTFAGPDDRTLYITARTSVYRVELGVRGGRY